MNPLPLSEYIYCDLFRTGTSTDTQCISFKSWLNDVILTDVGTLFVGNNKGYRIRCNDRKISQNILRHLQDYNSTNATNYNCDIHEWRVNNGGDNARWDGTLGIDGDVTSCNSVDVPLFVWRPCYNTIEGAWGGYNTTCGVNDAVMCIGYEPYFVNKGSAHFSLPNIINCFVWNIVFIIFWIV